MQSLRKSQIKGIILNNVKPLVRCEIKTENKARKIICIFIVLDISQCVNYLINNRKTVGQVYCSTCKNVSRKYSCKRQSAGSKLFRPKSTTLTLIARSWWHRPPCSSKICATHNHDKPQISPNCFFFYLHANGIYSAPYRLSSTCFGRQIPSTVVNLPTKFCDDGAKGVRIMANHF